MIISIFSVYNIENGGEPGLFEDDIILTPAQRSAIDTGGGLARGSYADPFRLWPNGVVPYTVDPTICKFKFYI